MVGGVGGTRWSRKGGLPGWETVAWCGDLVTVGGTGLVEGEVEVRTDYKKHFKNPRAGTTRTLWVFFHRKRFRDYLGRKDGGSNSKDVALECITFFLFKSDRRHS